MKIIILIYIRIFFVIFILKTDSDNNYYLNKLKHFPQEHFLLTIQCRDILITSMLIFRFQIVLMTTGVLSSDHAKLIRELE